MSVLVLLGVIGWLYAAWFWWAARQWEQIAMGWKRQALDDLAATKRMLGRPPSSGGGV